MTSSGRRSLPDAARRPSIGRPAVWRSGANGSQADSGTPRPAAPIAARRLMAGPSADGGTRGAGGGRRLRGPGAVAPAREDPLIQRAVPVSRDVTAYRPATA